MTSTGLALLNTAEFQFAEINITVDTQASSTAGEKRRSKRCRLSRRMAQVSFSWGCVNFSKKVKVDVLPLLSKGD